MGGVGGFHTGGVDLNSLSLHSALAVCQADLLVIRERIPSF